APDTAVLGPMSPRLPCLFFFQAEDGIRDRTVTGVQTCALPISPARRRWRCVSGSRTLHERCWPPSSGCSRRARVGGCCCPPATRSEERRVGKEGRARGGAGRGMGGAGDVAGGAGASHRRVAHMG